MKRSIDRKRAVYDQSVGYTISAPAPTQIPVDFTGDPEAVRLVVEGERLAYGHLFNPTFATEISRIDPLPHQYIAVYDHMLQQSRLRFLLADDAGAGKTIMTGLYIREMLMRRLISRILIVPPAGLVGNWEHELRTLFNLSFRIVDGSDARAGNPFKGPDSDLLIVSVDTLSGDNMFQRLQEPDVLPYDLVAFDEAHKLAADRINMQMRRTERYRLAEALAGIQDENPRWTLSWHTHHLLLLTATPHMGKDYPYYCLWRLLEPDALSTIDAFHKYPPDARRRHFIRRTKEELVDFDEQLLFPPRTSDTHSYNLSQGDISEQALYDATTSYIQTYYNRANLLNRSAARLAMSVFQRRLASSTYALLCSFERRYQKLAKLVEDMHSGRIDPARLAAAQSRLDEQKDVFTTKTADEEQNDEGLEENEQAEDSALEAVLASTLADLETELQKVVSLLNLARQVYQQGNESKFEKLCEVVFDEKYQGEKIIIFTEHRDTLEFLVRRLSGLGFTDRIAQIHGGMNYNKREEQVALFRKPMDEGGALYLVATDAAGEGINLQVCWLMVNYDIPWNPARLEQRMGRIHRYGQKHDRVYVANLVAGKTREGRVMQTLLEKLERIRREMGSDKVFDVIGHLYENISLRNYMEQVVMGDADAMVGRIEGTLTKEQVRALQEQERRRYGDGGEVKSKLKNLKKNLENEIYRRLLPGYVRRFMEKAAPLVDLGIDGDLDTFFNLRPLKPGSMDWLTPMLEVYPPGARAACTVYPPVEREAALFLHPGEPVFDRFRVYVCERFRTQALHGGIFIDPTAIRPYFFHLALLPVYRRADPALRALSRPEMLEYCLVGLRQEADGSIEPCPAESLLFLRGSPDLPASAVTIAMTGDDAVERARLFASNEIAEQAAEKHRSRVDAEVPTRIAFIEQSFAFQEADLARQRKYLSEKAQQGNDHAKGELTKIRQRQREMGVRKAEVVQTIQREPELIAAGDVIFLAHGLVVPSGDPEDRQRYNDEVEAQAMQIACAFEETHYNARVYDVSKPEGARKAGLEDYPGFDLFSHRSNGEKVAIEVKGRAGSGAVELSENEWIKACNHRQRYWLYVAYDCARTAPILKRVQDPFGKLIVHTKERIVIDEHVIFEAAEEE